MEYIILFQSPLLWVWWYNHFFSDTEEWNCTVDNYCSQGLNPGKAIAEIKKLLSGIAKKDAPGLDTAALH